MSEPLRLNDGTIIDDSDWVIDPEFKALIPPLSAAEYAQLEENILSIKRCRERLIVWGDYIIDGHNRLEICNKHGIIFDTEEISFASREEAMLWIIKNQLGRRNLTDEQRSYVRGKQYEVEKAIHGGDRKSEKSSSQFGNLANNEKTAEKIAEQHNVSKNTIIRDAQKAAVIDKIGEVSESAKDKVLSGGTGISKGALMKLCKAPEEEIEAVALAIDSGTYTKPKVDKKEKEPGTPPINGPEPPENRIAGLEALLKAERGRADKAYAEVAILTKVRDDLEQQLERALNKIRELEAKERKEPQ